MLHAWRPLAFVTAVVVAFGVQETPGVRAGHSLVFDPERREVLLFDGYPTEPTPPARAEIWSWTGSRWRRISADGPVPGSLSTAVYDTARKRVMVFGGISSLNASAIESSGAVWEWDGQRWEQREFSGGPGPRDHHAAAYDETRRRVVVYGGHQGDGNRPLATGTWEWDGERWHQFAAAEPGPRGHLAMAYDPVRKRVLLHGGSAGRRTYADTWAWDGQAWTKIADEAPGPRSRHRMAFDSARGRMVMHGGLDMRPGPMAANAETWELVGDHWIRAADGPPRMVHAMAFDPVRRRIVVFGGASNGMNTLGDTWEWDGTKWAMVSGTTGEVPGAPIFPRY